MPKPFCQALLWAFLAQFPAVKNGAKSGAKITLRLCLSITTNPKIFVPNLGGPSHKVKLKSLILTSFSDFRASIKGRVPTMFTNVTSRQSQFPITKIAVDSISGKNE